MKNVMERENTLRTEWLPVRKGHRRRELLFCPSLHVSIFQVMPERFHLEEKRQTAFLQHVRVGFIGRHTV